MIDKDAQLAILADALTKIVDVAAMDQNGAPATAELLIRAGDLAAQALSVAATYGPLPPALITSASMAQDHSNDNGAG